MPKIHYFQRYSTRENTVTNNTLQLIARIYDYSTSQASRLLSDLTGEQIEIGIDINQQEHGKSSVPDGAILQRSFKILIEAKVDAKVDVGQLISHSGSFTSESQKVLLLLTVQGIGLEVENNIRSQIREQVSNVIFKNITYEQICNSVRPLFKEHEYNMRSLVEDYIEYCNDAGLTDQSQYLMRIVPCGQSFELNKKYGIYFQPQDRGYTQHAFVGIYANKAVRVLWKIDSVFDVDFSDNVLKKELVCGRPAEDYDLGLVEIIKEAKEKCDYDIQDGHRFFCGKPLETNYEKNSVGGIQGARLVNLREIIGDFGSSEDVAQKLKGRKWA